MIFFLAFLVVVFVSKGNADLSDDILKATEVIAVAQTKCMKEHPSVTQDILDKFKANIEFPENPTEDTKCFVLCMSKEFETAVKTDDGKHELHADNLEKFTIVMTQGKVTKEEAKAIVEKCVDKVKEHTECDKFYHYAVCKIEAIKHHELIFKKM